MPMAMLVKSRAGAKRMTPAPLVGLLALGVLGLTAVIWLLWPRWPEVPIAADTPALPVVVAGVTFNVPPAAVRMAVQRHPGPQDRIDLVYLWPALTPPESKPADGTAGERLFVTIAGQAGTLAPSERLKTIYPRYADENPSPGPDGLALFAFRDGTPYQGEDLLFDHIAPERFLVRCSRDVALAPGSCLYERFVGEASVTVRFPRAWLSDWRELAAGFERLMAQLRPGAP